MLRWRTAHLYLQEKELVASTTDVVHPSQAPQLSLLEHLTVEPWAPPPISADLLSLLHVLFSYAPRLRSLRLQGWTLPQSVSKSLTHPGFPWHQLSSLSLHIQTFEPDAILAVISATPQLVTLEVLSCIDVDSFERDSVLSSALRSSAITLPALTTLLLHLHMGRLHYGTSEALDVLCAETGPALAHFLKALAFPALGDATLVYENRNIERSSTEINTASIISALEPLLTWTTTTLSGLDQSLSVGPHADFPGFVARVVSSQLRLDYLCISRHREYAAELAIDPFLEAILSKDANTLKIIAVRNAGVQKPRLLADVVIKHRISVVLTASSNSGGASSEISRNLFQSRLGSGSSDKSLKELSDAAAMLKEALSCEGRR